MVVDNCLHLQKQPIYQGTFKAIFKGTIEIRLPYFWQVSCLYIERTEEEANTKIAVHVKHCLLQTVDTDNITQLLSLLDSL